MDIYRIPDALIKQIDSVVLGKHRIAQLVTAALICGGHILIEDVPGTGKTTLAAALAAASGLKCTRAQFTPDVTASDITGFNVYNQHTDRFEMRPGLVMCNILLADEINRASPKTQSALFEAMQERRVSVDGVTFALPDPFMVAATQNPAGFVGTYPLPEAQLDRFLMKLSMGYPTVEEEIAVISRRVGRDPLESVTPVCGVNEIKALRAQAEQVFVSPLLMRYIALLVSATRNSRDIELGASPRASVALMKVSRAWALINHRNYVLPEDTAQLFVPVVSHRIILSRESRASGLSCEKVLNEILRTTPVPSSGMQNQ